MHYVKKKNSCVISRSLEGFSTCSSALLKGRLPEIKLCLLLKKY